jgi:hypothetical protein
MNFSGVKKKAKELLDICGEVLGTLPEAARKTGVSFVGRFPERQRKPMLFALGGLVVLFLILVITLAALDLRKEEDAPVSNVTGPAIPAEELFIPAEPDFVPEFLPAREPRSSWSVEDIRPYWKNPENTELWRGEIKSAVDKLMEAVP